VSIETKICRICNIDKPLTEYRKDRGAVYSRCKECCSKDAKTLRGIKKSAPEKPSHCQCCKKDMSDSSFYCDHDHDLLVFRGWICFDCNQGIGFLNDNIKGILAALVYLIRYKIRIKYEGIRNKWTRVRMEPKPVLHEKRQRKTKIKISS